MKRIFSFVAACATMFALAACQEELQQPVEEQKPVLEGIEGELQEVTFYVNLEDKAQTKSISDGLSANILEYAVYYAEQGTLDEDKQDVNHSSKYKPGDYIEVLSIGKNAKIEESGARTWKVTLTLAKNVKYDIVFWAYAEGAPYTFNEAKAKIIVNDYEGAANDEIRDAFYGICKGYSVISSDERVELSRPFAQINFGACDYIPYVTDLGLKVTSKIDTEAHDRVEAVYEFNDPDNGRLLYPERPKVAECTVPNTLNVLDGTVSGEAVVKFQLADIPFKGGDEVLLNAKNAEGENIPYHWMGMNYILAGAEATINNIHATFHYNGQDLVFDVPNVPYKRNYKTNIIGNLFTENAKFNVVVLPDYENEIIIKDGQAYAMPEIKGNEYIVKTSTELAWIADQVNSGLNDFAGKTVSIASDINLSNYNWTPIGTNEYPFKGSIQGRGVQVKSGATPVSISGLKVDHAEGPAGLVGVLDGGYVKNITLVEPDVKGAEYVGAVVGKIFTDGLVEEVSVTRGQVTGHHYVGGLVGYAYGSVKKSAVDGVKVSGVYVDEDLDGAKIGGVIGFHPIDADDTEVSGNVIKSLDITGKREVGAIAGAANAKNIKDNNVESATIAADEYAGVIVGHVYNDEGDDVELSPKANTYAHEQIYVNGEQAKPVEYIFEVAYDAENTAIPVEGGEFTVTVTGNVAWTVTVPEGVTASLAEGEGAAEVIFTVGANEKTEEVSYTVGIATTEQACAVKSFEIVLNQEAVQPVGPTEVTVAEFLAAAEDETMYQLTGVITSVSNTTYGNFYLKDATGEVYIYGLCSPEGAQKYWAESGAKVGDTITVQTVRTSFNGAPQGKNAIFVALVPFVAQASEWGVVGDLNNWGGTSDIVMYNTWHTENLYVAYNVEIASGAFKIRANNKWDDNKNYGLEVAGSIYADKYYAVKSAGDSKDATLMAYGTYDVYFDLANKRVALMTPGKAYAEAVDGGQPIVVVAGLKDHAWGVIGSFEASNGWTVDVEMSVEGDYAVAKNVTLANGDLFKIRSDKSWDTPNYGTGSDVNVGDVYTTYKSGDNMKFVGETGAYNLYFSLIDAKFHMEEYVEAPAVTVVEATMASFGWANAGTVKEAKLDDNVTLTFAQGKASTAPAYYTSGEAVRLYQNGATLKVDANGKTIKSIKITFAQKHYYIAPDSGEFSAEGEVRTWTGSAESVLFTTTGTDKNHRAYVSAIEVTYE